MSVYSENCHLSLNHPSEVLLVAVIILYGYSKDEWVDACVAISIFSLT